MSNSTIGNLENDLESFMDKDVKESSNPKNIKKKLKLVCLILTMILIVLLIISFITFFQIFKSSYFSHIRLVDHNKNSNNFLFRGGKIVNDNGVFTYSELKLMLQLQAMRKNIKLQDDFYLIDICLLNEGDPVVDVEREFFEKNPHLGEFIWYPILGLSENNISDVYNNRTNNNIMIDQPRDFPDDEIELVAKSWLDWGNFDDLPNRLENVHHLLNNLKKDKPVVIYVHCRCGCDRTGEFFASYYMKYQQKTYTEAMKYDLTIHDRYIVYENQLMTQWYCEYLFYTDQYPQSEINDCGNCEDFR
eukprot:TRINITY_DN967_c0_g1_i2.p1 TRINITY_DN967_c0_g1~~TRINITY_DN967_c0_g1_i2.p1  ORF type:complete len:320 (+),score=62.40 TRINITY_DN967_c0_g1_i2:51-962(+)